MLGFENGGSEGNEFVGIRKKKKSQCVYFLAKNLPSSFIDRVYLIVSPRLRSKGW